MAEYEMQQLTLPNGGEKPLLYPRMRLQGCIDLEYLAEKISSRTTYAKSEVKAAMQEITEWMTRYMADGYSVKIEGLGTFTASLGLRKGKERETDEPGERRRNAASICVRNVHFRPDKELVKRTDAICRPVRSTRKFQRSSDQYTPQERLQLALAFLDKYGMMKVLDYCMLTGLLKVKASRELVAWSEDPESGICARGEGSHKIYIRRG